MELGSDHKNTSDNNNDAIVIDQIETIHSKVDDANFCDNTKQFNHLMDPDTSIINLLSGSRDVIKGRMPDFFWLITFLIFMGISVVMLGLLSIHPISNRMLNYYNLYLAILDIIKVFPILYMILTCTLVLATASMKIYLILSGILSFPLAYYIASELVTQYELITYILSLIIYITYLYLTIRLYLNSKKTRSVFSVIQATVGRLSFFVPIAAFVGTIVFVIICIYGYIFCVLIFIYSYQCCGHNLIATSLALYEYMFLLWTSEAVLLTIHGILIHFVVHSYVFCGNNSTFRGLMKSSKIVILSNSGSILFASMLTAAVRIVRYIIDTARNEARNSKDRKNSSGIAILALIAMILLYFIELVLGEVNPYSISISVLKQTSFKQSLKEIKTFQWFLLMDFIHSNLFSFIYSLPILVLWCYLSYIASLDYQDPSDVKHVYYKIIQNSLCDDSFNSGLTFMSHYYILLVLTLYVLMFIRIFDSILLSSSMAINFFPKKVKLYDKKFHLDIIKYLLEKLV